MPVLPPKHNWFVHLQIMTSQIALTILACGYLVPEIVDTNIIQAKGKLEQVYLGQMLQNMKDHEPKVKGVLTQLEQIKFRADSLNSLRSFNTKTRLPQTKILGSAINEYLSNNKNQQSDQKQVTKNLLKLIELYTNIVRIPKSSRSMEYKKGLKIWLDNIESKIVGKDIQNKSSHLRKRLSTKNIYLNSNDQKLAKNLSQENLKSLDLTQYTISSKRKSFFNKFEIWLGSIFQNNNIKNISKLPLGKTIYSIFLRQNTDSLVSKMNLVRRVVLNNLQDSIDVGNSQISVPNEDLFAWLIQLRSVQQSLELYIKPEFNLKNVQDQIKNFTQFLTKLTVKNTPVLKHNLEVFVCWYKDFKQMNRLQNDMFTIPEFDNNISLYKGLVENLEYVKKIGNFGTWLETLDHKNLSENLIVPAAITIDKSVKNSGLLIKQFKNWVNLQNTLYEDYTTRLHSNNEQLDLEETTNNLKLSRQQIHYLELLENKVVSKLNNQNLQKMLTGEILIIKTYWNKALETMPESNSMNIDLWWENVRHLINMHAFDTQNKKITNSMDTLYQKYTQNSSNYNLRNSIIISNKNSLLDTIKTMPNFYNGEAQNSAIELLSTFEKTKILMKEIPPTDERFLNTIQFLLVAYAADNNTNTSQISKITLSQIEEFPKKQ